MKAEELFQINQKINQIKRNLQVRQQKASEWVVPYQKILKEKPDKAVYLSKTTQNFRNSLNETTQKQNYNLQSFDYTQRKEALNKKVKQSRKKIKEHYNELKQLDQLNKKKTKIRQITLKQLQQQRQNQEFTKQLSKTFNNSSKNNGKIGNMSKMKKSHKEFNVIEMDKSMSGQDNFYNLNMSSSGLFSQTFSPNAFSNINLNINGVRTAKDRVNPFTNIKADKFIEIYQDLKSQNKVNQEGFKQVFKTFGIGLQNTPYSTLMKKREQKLKKQALQSKSNNSPSHGQKQQNQSKDSLQILQSQRDQMINSSIKSSKNYYKFQKSKPKLQCKKNLPKALEKVILQKQNIYATIQPWAIQGEEFYDGTVTKNTGKRVYGSVRNRPNIFENRMKKILKYHGNFWNDEFQHEKQDSKPKSFQHTYDKFLKTINLNQIDGSVIKLKSL